MNFFKLLAIIIILIISINAQDSLNCRLISTTGDLTHAYCIDLKDNYLIAAQNNILKILDMSDKINPTVIYSNEYPAEYELNSIFIKDNYAFIGAGYNGLIILDITDIDTPVLAAQLPTDKYVEEVELYQNIAFLGTLNHGFKIVDVSDPFKPAEKGRVDHGIDDVWEFDFKDNMLFVAAEDSGVKIYNIDDPANPLEIANLHTIPTTIKDVKVKNNYVFAINNNIYVFDISDINNPKQIYEMKDVGGNASIEDNFLYTTGCSNSRKLNVIDISNPELPVLSGYYPLPNVSSPDIFVKNKLAYIACQSSIYLVKFDNPTKVGEKKNQIKTFTLRQNYPNPFNPETTIKFNIAKSTFVSLKVYDVLGNEIAILVNENKEPGNYEVTFWGLNLSSGMYIYKLVAENFVSTKKMILLR